MSTDPSLSSFLTQQDASSSALPPSEASEAALLNYFQAPYHGEATLEQITYHSPSAQGPAQDSTDLALANAYGPPSGNRGSGLLFDYAAELAYRPRSPSPIDHTIDVPDALADLAAATALPVPPSIRPVPATPAKDLSQHGEMGGKRRKNPSDRAGWKEMDEAGGSGLKRRKKKQDSPWQAGEMDAEAQASLAEINATEDGKALEAPVPDEAEEASKTVLGRAEQNRRAQQAFRRRREQRIIQLEADSEALKPTRELLVNTQGDLASVSLNYDAALLEIAALRGALTTLAERTGLSALDEYGHLVVSDQRKNREPSTREAADLQDALKLLVGQSRVLAKQRRAETNLDL